ncbi:hypothetical protein Q5752_000842 [Cryptotrichosporon argae]
MPLRQPVPASTFYSSLKMPSKPGRRQPDPDWSWVGTEARTAADITPEHRRRAAGYLNPSGAGPACRYWLTEYEADGLYGLGKAKKGCGAKKCLEWPRCYNHLGGQDLVSDFHQSQFVGAAIGPATEVRTGPAGLRNFGATCYANAFLQVWYHNVAFRNGVYACVAASSPTSPLYHLASIFAALQHGKRKVVDPGVLIDALQLKKGDQQDAAEFSKLFMDLIEKEIKRQPNPLNTFVTDQFAGQLVYLTRCNTCGYVSTSPSAFLELEVGLKDKASLPDQIRELFLPERLDGDNKYKCPQCDSLQAATRTMILDKLPPVLHLSFLRFVYDVGSGSRKKSKASIAYPRVITLLDKVYELRGVVIHHGPSAFHGHFTCEVYDESDGQWYKCDDETVSTVDERPKKKVRLDPDPPGEQTSKDAYMLVYQVRKAPTLAVDPPSAILEAIKADNAAIENEADERKTKIKELSQLYERLREAKMGILRVLPGDDCIVPRDALSNWVQGTTEVDLTRAFDYQHVLCDHGNINPAHAGHTRLISREAFDRLGILAPLPDIEVCSTCVQDLFALHVAKKEHSELVSTFENLNQTCDNSRWCIPRSWIKEWRGGLLAPGVDPTHQAYSILCEHSQPWDGKHEVITDDALAHLQSLFGDFFVFTEDTPRCAICAAAQAQSKEDNREREELLKRERPISRNQRNISHAFGMTNYLLPASFTEVWEVWLNKDYTGERPKLEMNLCEHGLLDVDVGLDKGTYLTSTGWMQLCEIYNHDPHDCVTVEYAAAPEAGKRLSVVKPSVPTCEPCRRKRLLDFETTALQVVLKEDKASDVVVLDSKLRTRALAAKSGGKRTMVTVNKNTTVKDIKLKLTTEFQLFTICQRLYYNGRVLNEDETVKNIGILAADTLDCEEIKENRDALEVQVIDGRAEGFGGTALQGRIPCPACTLLNPCDAMSCEMCDTPL